MISGPMRAAWSRLPPGEARGWKVLGPLVLSATLVLFIVTFFTQFAHPISEPDVENVIAIDQRRFSDIYVMNADGTGQTRLTASPDMYARYSAWPPDDRTIMFSAQAHTTLSNPHNTQSIAIARILLQSALLMGPY